MPLDTHPHFPEIFLGVVLHRRRLTWSEAKPTRIDSSHSPGHLARLADGRLALAWNPTVNQRRELHVALSIDDGKSWTKSLVAVRGR